MHSLNRLPGDRPVPDVRLIGDDHKQIADVTGPQQRLSGVRIDSKRLERARRKTTALTRLGDHEDSVAIEKNGRAQRPWCVRHHHLVLRTCRMGWLTRQCHTTAWNASESGVTHSDLR